MNECDIFNLTRGSLVAITSDCKSECRGFDSHP